MDGLPLGLIGEIGLGTSSIIRASGSKVDRPKNGPIPRKRASEAIANSPKRALLLSSVERHPERLFNDVYNFESPLLDNETARFINAEGETSPDLIDLSSSALTTTSVGFNLGIND